MPTKGLKRGAMNCATTNGHDSEIARTECPRRNELRDYEPIQTSIF